MEVVMIELLLWIGLIFFFWVIHNQLHQIASEIKSTGLFSGDTDNPATPQPYESPERVFDAIGSYMDSPIYRFAVFGGRQYQFDSICPPGSRAATKAGQRCMPPGLLYRPCFK